MWPTVAVERRVLIVVRTVTTLSRLLDIATLLERDVRVQLVFTHDEARPAILGDGVADALRDLRVPTITWGQATGIRFDLAIAASENDALHELDAPILLVPHGIGFQKYYPGGRTVAGMNPERLVHDGRVVPEVIALSHEAQREQLRESCPPAAARAVVIGDPALDRMLGSGHRAGVYRRALGARGRRLVVVASTWGPGSVFGSAPELPYRLVTELDVDEFAVCAVLHPGIASAHGAWMVSAWLAEAVACGLRIVRPEAGWQAALSAASVVVSGSGSLSLYSAALRRPLLLTGGSASTVAGSPAELLATGAPWLDQDIDLADQLRSAVAGYDPRRDEAAVRRAVAGPGLSAEALRGLLYGSLRLTEPAGAAEYPLVDVPPPRSADPPALVVGVDPGDRVRIRRYPARTGGKPHLGLDFRHVVAHGTDATVTQLESASVVYTRLDHEEHGEFGEWAAETLRQWPDASLAAATTDRHTCLVRNRHGTTLRLSVTSTEVDPLALASLCYLHDVQGTTPSTVEHVLLGERTVQVRVGRVASAAPDTRPYADDPPRKPL
ncbi:hypothetical protein [Amycolatopsis antarctica]|uniref:hypothetical protein n=1 Tax=Amycolatopsis antarctica TaxID=1854586 RepID=UPI00196B26AF|nr:hypothetical protein [Amycolatopsis antarctica]